MWLKITYIMVKILLKMTNFWITKSSKLLISPNSIKQEVYIFIGLMY